jgi:hypothetical protein
MARSGLSEAVDASSGAPEKRCPQTPREHEAACQKPAFFTLRRRFVEQRHAASENNFARHPLGHPTVRSGPRPLSKKEMNRRRRGETQGSIERLHVETRADGYGLTSGAKP